jgi:hypothetical protein
MLGMSGVPPNLTFHMVFDQIFDNQIILGDSGIGSMSRELKNSFWNARRRVRLIALQRCFWRGGSIPKVGS